MMKKQLSILSMVCLLLAQVIVATHIHNTDDAIAETQCVYCQTAAEISGRGHKLYAKRTQAAYYRIFGRNFRLGGRIIGILLF